MPLLHRRVKCRFYKNAERIIMEHIIVRVREDRKMSRQEEYFDIYDGNKQPTGRTMKREGSFLREGEYCLIVLCIIERKDHTFLITRRAEDKHWAPGAWEVPGGGVRAGETSAEAVIREAREETGLDLTGCEIRLIDSYSNVDLKRGDNYFVDIYHVWADFEEADVRIESSEATAYALVPMEKITELSRESRFLHYERIVHALSLM